MFALTSKVETFGIVYIEAMQQGLPCIGTKGQGAEDIITPENGLLVEYGDVDALGNAMKRIRSNYKLYNRCVIADTCKMEFSSSGISDRIGMVYDRAVRGGNLNSL